jgi:hypothetical protein
MMCNRMLQYNIKTNAIPFSHKANSIHFNCHVCDVLILCTECVKDLGVMLDNKLCFHQHVNLCIFPGWPKDFICCFS